VAAAVVVPLLLSCAAPADTSSAGPPAVPFALVRNQVVLQATLQGRGPYACLVDTGANPSAVDLATARELGLPMGDRAAPADGVGSDDVLVTPTEMHVAAAGSETARVAAVAFDLSALARGLGQPLQCILGQSWLAARVVEIDYPRQRLRLAASAPAPGMACHTMPMRFWLADDLMPLVTMRVNGVDVPVSLDTGSSATVRLFPEGAALAGVADPRGAGDQAAATGARGRTAVRKAVARRLQLGPLALVDAPVTIGEHNAGEPPGARAGNAGNGLLRHGVLTLDYPARRIRICAATAPAR
jgi:predicted aspartyl protease